MRSLSITTVIDRLTQLGKAHGPGIPVYVDGRRLDPTGFDWSLRGAELRTILDDEALDRMVAAHAEYVARNAPAADPREAMRAALES